RLGDTGLLKPGATGSFARHFKLKNHSPSTIETIKKDIYKDITDTGVKIRLPEDSSAQTGRVINTITNFMALSALIGLILSLVGVFYLYQSHLLARLKDLCLMNLYGLTKKEIILGIIAQFSFVFFLVILAEIIIIFPVYKSLAPVLSETFGFDLSGNVNV